jgi:hypothetical protein
VVSDSTPGPALPVSLLLELNALGRRRGVRVFLGAVEPQMIRIAARGRGQHEGIFGSYHQRPRQGDALPWAQTPIAARQVDCGHGRVTTRTIQVMAAPEDLPFPHVNRVWLIERYVTALDGTPTCAVAALGVTNLTTDTTAPQRPAALVRNRWAPSRCTAYVTPSTARTTPPVRTRSGPRVMAGLRNLAVGAHHLAGRRAITEASREAGRVMHRPFKILELTCC